jgi:hypothetical protein
MDPLFFHGTRIERIFPSGYYRAGGSFYGTQFDTYCGILDSLGGNYADEQDTPFYDLCRCDWHDADEE